MTKSQITKQLKLKGYTLDCYDKEISRLSDEDINKVMSRIGWGSTDVLVDYGNKVVTVDESCDDDTIDLSILTKEEYISRYGDEKYEN